MADWVWDHDKERTNRNKRGLRFELEQWVFEDPVALSRLDDSAEEERWQTVGLIGNVAIFAVHTVTAEAVPGRIISARKATPHESRAYEEGDF